MTAPKVDTPKIDPSKSTDKKFAAMPSGEIEVYSQLLQDTGSTTPNYKKALTDLTTWSRRYPATSFESERAYYYVHVYNALGQSDMILGAAAPLVTAGVARVYDDPQRVLQILVAASASIQKIPQPTKLQLSTAERAARQLLDFLPDYFAPSRKPANVTDAAWTIARNQLEAVAKQVIERRPGTLASAR